MLRWSDIVTGSFKILATTLKYGPGRGAAAVAKDKTKSIKDLSIYRWLSSELFIFVLGFRPRFNVVFPPCCNVAVLAHVCADVGRQRR